MIANKSQRPIEILLIEDNPGDADLAREALEESKFTNHITVASDGEEAIRYLRKAPPFTEASRPDLILLDLNLPRKDGREVLAEVKQDEDLKRIPIVILTTSQAPDDVRKSYNLHANCYINKPLDLKQFMGIVKSIENFWLSVVILPNGKN